MGQPIQVIDLFAGPGGLGEGFFSLHDESGNYPFEGVCSVEKDAKAHATLTLRAFYRLLQKNKEPIPKQYYQYANGEAASPACEKTKSLWKRAQEETIQLEIGSDHKRDKDIFNRVRERINKGKSDTPSLLIGGPPCQAYSLVGRARNKGIKDYNPEDDHRHFLYKEYLWIMKLTEPDFFVMENVKGLLSSNVNGGRVFDKIVDDLENCGKGYDLFSLKTGKKYIRGKTNPRDFLLCSEDYGVPQNRHRVIIFGIRKNSKFKRKEVPSLTISEKVTVEQAISDLPKLRSTLSNRGQKYKADSETTWRKNIVEGIGKLIKNKSTDEKLKSALANKLKQFEEGIHPTEANTNYQYSKKKNAYQSFVLDSKGKSVLGHEPRPHMDSDLLRYFFCATFREVYGRNAKANDFPAQLAPSHKNWDSGKFVDRFKVQSYHSFSSTVTSHISKDGHYFIHSDANQCRSLTAREAARLQSFPDSYVFVGKRTSQFHQIGNAVPPLLARQIATIINSLV